MIKNYKIAELTVRMDPEYPTLFSQSRPYLCDDTSSPICDIFMTPKIYEQMEKKYPYADRELIEYMVTGADFYNTLITHTGFLLHSSAVVYEDKAYLFSAPSGTGKSTHTGLWLKEFKGAEILNDDKPAIRILEDGIYVYGTPWSGKTDLSLNRKVKLQGIAFLERGEENKISPMPSMKALENLLNQTVRPGERSLAGLLLDHLSALITRVPIYQFSCNMDPEAAHVSYETMSKGIVK